jgi:nucleoside-diphosphate-sugar epimerase
MAKILVTGGMGFIGHNVVSLLEQQGHDVAIIDSQTSYGIINRRELDQLLQQRARKIRTQRRYVIDVAHPDVPKIFAAYQPDIVIHLASFPRQQVVNMAPTIGSRAMSEGLLNLLEASVKNHVKKFVYISSSMIYGNFKFADEEHTTSPIGQYAIMKLAGEWLVRDYQRTGMSCTILRPSAVYGPMDVEDRVVSKFLATAMRGGEIQVNGPDELLDFSFISDIADGIVTATTSDNTNNMTYNLSRGQTRTLLEAAELAVRIAGQGTIRVNKPDANFPSRGYLNISRAVNDFGFSPIVTIEQGFEEYYSWLRSQ